MTNSVRPSLQDFSLVKTHVDLLVDTYGIGKPSLGFYYFTLDLILNLQVDEIEDSITDTSYLQLISDQGGHDRGIDALYIDSNTIPNTIHFINCKYTDNFNKTGNHFPASEIDKILGFLSALMQKDESLKNEINGILYSKVEEIWTLFQSQNPNFVIHICCNYYNGLEEGEKKRFEKEINKYSNFQIEYHLMPDFVLRLTQKDIKQVDARIKGIDKNFFEKSDGDIRALIVDVDARDLIRIVLDDENIRNAVDLDDYENIKDFKVLEDAFEDNVRIYLKLRTKINRNIKETSLSEENYRFFYYNNGITMTCDHFSYPKSQRGPIIELKNLQIVNGSQTIHALYEAFLQDSSKFDDIDVLCRIYQTNNSELSTSIAEYTNSQNPVKTRDIRSNDFAQKKLEKELSTKGYFYERKKGQYQNEPRSKRIDAEKTGQVLMAFYNKLPAEAKDQKRLIFAEKYDDVFNDDITANHILIATELFDRLETIKKSKRSEILQDQTIFETESFILHASYYILYLLGEIAKYDSIPIAITNIDDIWAYYDEAIELIKKSINEEQNEIIDSRENYNHRVFFKGNRPKNHIELLLKKRAQM